MDDGHFIVLTDGTSDHSCSCTNGRQDCKHQGSHNLLRPKHAETWAKERDYSAQRKSKLSSWLVLGQVTIRFIQMLVERNIASFKQLQSTNPAFVLSPRSWNLKTSSQSNLQRRTQKNYITCVSCWGIQKKKKTRFFVLNTRACTFALHWITEMRRPCHATATTYYNAAKNCIGDWWHKVEHRKQLKETKNKKDASRSSGKFLPHLHGVHGTSKPGMWLVFLIIFMKKRLKEKRGFGLKFEGNFTAEAIRRETQMSFLESKPDSWGGRAFFWPMQCNVVHV